MDSPKNIPLALILISVSVASPSAYAFHSAMLFPDKASVGGGGGLFYNGSPRHKGYTCAACHVSAPGLARLNVTSDPPSLFTDGTWEPGAVYSISVTLENETRGLDAVVNYNTFGVEVLDGNNEPAGAFENFSEGDMVTTLALDALFARGQNNSGATAWSFDWRAPDSGSGPVTFYLSGVDGNGANDTGEPLTDPQGDDVISMRLNAREVGTPAPVSESSGCSSTGGAPGPAGAVILLLMMVAGCRLGRRYLLPT